MITGGISPARPMYAQFRSIAEGVCRADRSGSRCIPPPPRPLQVRNAPPTLGRTGGWGGREHGADGRLGRKGAWGGREHGADGSMGRKGVYMGRKGVWDGREPGAEGSMGRKGVWGDRHIPTHHPHHPPLAPSSYDISQPAGRHLPYFICLSVLYVYNILEKLSVRESSVWRKRKRDGRGEEATVED
jgi:hypothetical protein